MPRNPTATAIAAIMLMGFTLLACSPPEPPFPAEPSERGWRWPGTVSPDGEHLNPPGTFGVLRVRTGSIQTEQLVTAVNQQVDGPITFLSASESFAEEFLGTEEPLLTASRYFYDPTQVEVHSESEDPYYLLKTLDTYGQPPEFSKIRWPLFESDYPEKGWFDLDNGNLSESAWGSAHLTVSRHTTGESWEHWVLYPRYWEAIATVPKHDPARTDSGAVCFTHEGKLHILWGHHPIDSDFLVSTLAEGDDPTAFTEPVFSTAIISPENGQPIGSNYTPAVAVFRDQIYLAWTTRENGELRILRTDSAEFEPERSEVSRFSDLAGTGPALINIGRRKLIVAFRGHRWDFFNDEDETIYIRETTDGLNWSDPRAVAWYASEENSPSLAYLSGRTMLAYRDMYEETSYIRYSDDDGATWSDPKVIEKVRAGFETPAPFVFGLDSRDRADQLVGRDPDDLFYLMIGQRVNSFGPQQDSFEFLDWNWTPHSNVSSMCYFNYRFYVLSRASSRKVWLSATPYYSEYPPF